MTTGPVLACDLGGTRLRVARVEADGAVRDKQVIPTPPDDPGALSRLLRRALDTSKDFVGIVIGVPGPIDYEGGTPLRLPNLPGWEGHRVSLVLEQSVAWQTWTAHNGQWLDQLAFAELIEQRMIDVADPDGGTLLEIVQSFHATTDVQFKSGTRLNSGEIQFTYEETQEARAGRKGDLTIPDHFVLVMRPYVGGPAYRIRASLRYRVKPDGIKLGFVLERPEEVLEAAFKDVVGIIRDGAEATDERPAVQPITAPMFYGQP